MDQETAAEIKRHFDVVAESLRSEIRLVDEKSDRRSDDLERRLRSEMQDVKRHFDVVGEGLRFDIRLVAEGVAGLDEKFTLEFVRVREEIGAGRDGWERARRASARRSVGRFDPKGERLAHAAARSSSMQSPKDRNR